MTAPEIVAEISANHLGSIDNAIALIRAAAKAGAQAVKLQTWTSGKMVLDRSLVIQDGPWAGRNIADLYAEAHTPALWHQKLFDVAKEEGIQIFSSVFDAPALALLESLGCPRYKIASFEITDLPLIAMVARTGKPMIISTGMATAAEINDAYMIARTNGCTDITLLKCTSAYPAEPRTANLHAMFPMRGKYKCKVGFSDHTQGIGVAVAAAALGASMIEKHLTLSRAAGGPDAAFSLEPLELEQLCTEALRAYQALGITEFKSVESEQPQRALRRSLYVAKDMAAGEVFAADCLATARPANGISPNQYSKVLNCKAKTSIKAGTLLVWDMVSG